MTQNPCHSLMYQQLKIHVLPPSNQKAHHFSKKHEIRKPFSNLHHGKWNSQKLQRIAHNPLNSPILIQNHAKFALSTLISQDSLSPLAKLPKFTTFAHLCIFTDFALFTLAGKQPRLERIQRTPP